MNAFQAMNEITNLINETSELAGAIRDIEDNSESSIAIRILSNERLARITQRESLEMLLKDIEIQY